jgi:hypothetical protein
VQFVRHLFVAALLLILAALLLVDALFVAALLVVALHAVPRRVSIYPDVDLGPLLDHVTQRVRRDDF